MIGLWIDKKPTYQKVRNRHKLEAGRHNGVFLTRSRAGVPAVLARLHNVGLDNGVEPFDQLGHVAIRQVDEVVGWRLVVNVGARFAHGHRG